VPEDNNLPRFAAGQTAAGSVAIAPAGEADLAELLVLVRAYCDFYEVHPSDERLLALSRALIADPERQGVQLIARGAEGEALGFATLYWSWSTSRAAPLGTMNDLFVTPRARGRGVGERLIAACLQRCSEHGAQEMEWQTAPDNATAQALYDRVGGRREDWLCYSLPVRG
jgi:GNAT superfamily N-acetyltransferase